VLIAAEDLGRLRNEIERIDRALVGLIRERVRVARLVLEAKEAAGLPVVDSHQETLVLRRSTDLAQAAGLPAAQIGEVFTRVIEITRQAELSWKRSA
jgi:chorismate mutase